ELLQAGAAERERILELRLDLLVPHVEPAVLVDDAGLRVGGELEVGGADESIDEHLVVTDAGVGVALERLLERVREVVALARVADIRPSLLTEVEAGEGILVQVARLELTDGELRPEVVRRLTEDRHKRSAVKELDVRLARVHAVVEA